MYEKKLIQLLKDKNKQYSPDPSLLLLSPTSQLITSPCCPSCKSVPSVTTATRVTHLDLLSDELCGIIQHRSLSTWKTRQTGKRLPCDLKLTVHRSSALCFSLLCFCCLHCGCSPHLHRHIWSTTGHNHKGQAYPLFSYSHSFFLFFLMYRLFHL